MSDDSIDYKETLLELLSSLQNLDIYSTKESIVCFQNKATNAIEKVGWDELCEYERSKFGFTKFGFIEHIDNESEQDEE